MGDESAFERLYERHVAPAWNLAVAVTDDVGLAAVAVSEAFATVFTALRTERVSATTPFRPYLLATTRATALDLLQAPHEPVPVPRDPSTAPLALAFSGLPELSRSVLWLTRVDGLRQRRVAPIIRQTPETTRQLVGRARRGLREQYVAVHLGPTADPLCSRSVRRLAAYAAGTLGTDDIEKLERHLSLCADCRDRCDHLTALDSTLASLAVPVPALLADDARVAWTAAVTPAPTRGLSERTEKVLAGVSAAAAAVGVFGAALVGVSGNGSKKSEDVSPIAPIVTQLATPRPGDLDIGIGFDPGGAASDSDRETDGVRGADLGTGDDEAVVTHLGGDGGESITVGDVTTIPGDGGGVDDPSGPDSDPPPKTNGDEPVVSIGTTVGDTPVAVDVGDDPGATVGPISVGSEPEPGEDTVEVGGPLEPLAPAADPVNDVTGGLGL